MRVIITGTSGMVGKGVLYECLDHDSVTEAVSIGRNSCGVKHPKHKEFIHKDFTDFSSISNQLRDYDACFFCMGVSSAGIKKDLYEKITYEYTMSLAKTLYELNPEMTFNYVSGQGTDSSEKRRMYWARVKGKTENDLMKMGFKQSYMFRPGAIIPLRGIKSRTKSYQFMYDYFMWLVKLVKLLAPSSVVNTSQIGQAMINSVLKGYDKKILSPKDIINLAGIK